MFFLFYHLLCGSIHKVQGEVRQAFVQLVKWLREEGFGIHLQSGLLMNLFLSHPLAFPL